MSEAEDTYWWHVGRNDIIKKQLDLLSLDPVRTRILNIGSGTGGTVPLLERYGHVTNVEMSEEAIQTSRQRGVDAVIKVDHIALPFEDETFDIAVAFDVLEHIDDDLSALKEWRRVLRDSGKLLLTVPAHAWLWSSHDESLHHYRRYSLSGVHQLLNIAGFKVPKRTYAITFSFPMILGYRFLSSLVPRQERGSYVQLPAPVNSLFISILRLEGSVLRHMNLPVGTSVLAVAEKDPERRPYASRRSMRP